MKLIKTVDSFEYFHVDIEDKVYRRSSEGQWERQANASEGTWEPVWEETAKALERDYNQLHEGK